MSLENATYYNAGYVNTIIDKNDEDDRYVSMRLKIDSMVRNKCYGKGQMNVSFEKSTVHVPFNVYARKESVIIGATMTDNLDQTFSNNLLGRSGRSSPSSFASASRQTLSWQYFASSVGYTRFFPGLQWQLRDEIGRPIDYDARFEPWYISSQG